MPQKQKALVLSLLLTTLSTGFCANTAQAQATPSKGDSLALNGNPIVRQKFTADLAALVHNNAVYIYAGQDEAPERRLGYVMNN